MEIHKDHDHARRCGHYRRVRRRALSRSGATAALVLVATLCGCQRGYDVRGLPARVARHRARARKVLRNLVRRGGDAPEARGLLTLQLGTYIIPELVRQCVNPPTGTRSNGVRFIIGELSGGYQARQALAKAVASELGRAVEPDSKMAGLDLFRTYPSDAGLAVVLGLMDDELPRVRMGAVSALCSLETRHYGVKYSGNLVRVLLDEDADVARYAARSLKSLAHPRVLRVIEETIPEIKDRGVAEAARYAVESIAAELE